VRLPRCLVLALVALPDSANFAGPLYVVIGDCRLLIHDG
jgi:hypothetical protein